MAADQSQFSKVPKKILFLISEKLIDEDFPIGNPYSDDFDEAYKTLSSISKYFDITATHEDVEFFAKFLEINDDLIADLFANNREQIKNKELIEQLIIPVAKSYDLHFTVWGTCTYTDYKGQIFDSYDEDWVEGSAQQQNSDGNWNTWEGRELGPTDYENFEESNYEFDRVVPLEEEKSVNDSILDRLVIENTQDVVKSLDKKTLLELRRIIDSRLRRI
jgi:hypothetical protein